MVAIVKTSLATKLKSIKKIYVFRWKLNLAPLISWLKAFKTKSFFLNTFKSKYCIRGNHRLEFTAIFHTFYSIYMDRVSLL